MKEIETKIIDINEKEVRDKLVKIGAKKVENLFYRRYVFSLSKIKEIDEFVRIRTDGKKTTITYKYREGSGLRNTEEIETEAGDFRKSARIFEKALKIKPIYQENKVEKWFYKNVEIDIIYWPLIKPILEIEGKSVKEVVRTKEKLNIKGKDIGNKNLDFTFKHYGQAGKDRGNLYFK
ncbi:hypothetical protein M1558_04170 [Candidatus Parvarchaeota archaeon]|nr:hypothetical protein [Candidatus Parvarchaeota archaeon]